MSGGHHIHGSTTFFPSLTADQLRNCEICCQKIGVCSITDYSVSLAQCVRSKHQGFVLLLFSFLSLFNNTTFYLSKKKKTKSRGIRHQGRLLVET